MTTDLSAVKTFKPGVPAQHFRELMRVFPPSHFERLLREGFPFYRTTFWFPFDRKPENIFETIATDLKKSAKPSPKVAGVEWWFSVLLTNATPQWILSCHFDRDNMALDESDPRVQHPEKGSVLFLNPVPYGELVVTDQVLKNGSRSPKQPASMQFIRPDRNLYAVFPGELYHGVIGRMWRPMKSTRLRVAMAVNYWKQPPAAEYMRDSRECMTAFKLDT